jgi:hypothetical protein
MLQPDIHFLFAGLENNRLESRWRFMNGLTLCSSALISDEINTGTIQSIHVTALENRTPLSFPIPLLTL